MAKTKGDNAPRVATELNAELKAAREKATAQKLANELLSSKSRAKKTSAGTGAGVHKVKGGLESRITYPGAVKPAGRNVGFVNASKFVKQQHMGLAKKKHLSVVELYKRASNVQGNSRKVAAVDSMVPSGPKTNVNSSATQSRKLKQIQIKGLAGPCAVQAEEFAPGTTAADIETAMSSIEVKVMRTTIVSQQPVVAAEIVFASREDALKAVKQFDGQIGDGRVLKFAVKSGPVDMAASAAPRCNNAGLNNGGAQIRPAEVLDGSYGFGGDVEMSDSVYTKPAANGVLKADAPSFRPAPRGRGFGGFYRGRGDRRGGRSFV